MFKIENAKNLFWDNPEKTSVTGSVKFEHLGDFVNFTAGQGDTATYAIEFFENAKKGVYGAVSDIAPVLTPVVENADDIVGEAALSIVRFIRDDILKNVVDPIASNALRWNELTEAKKQEWVAYRQSLLDITSTYPNPSYVWDKVEKCHELTNCTFPTKP